MENSTNGDPRGDIIARGIVTEERARVMYERYVLNCYPRYAGTRRTNPTIDSLSVARITFLYLIQFVILLTPSDLVRCFVSP